MKAVAYSVKPFEKTLLAEVNRAEHDITFLPAAFETDTVVAAKGSDFVIVFTSDAVSALIGNQPADSGVSNLYSVQFSLTHNRINPTK